MFIILLTEKDSTSCLVGGEKGMDYEQRLWIIEEKVGAL